MRLVEQRAVALATVLLTRHPDVTVVKTSVPDTGYDLDVHIATHGALSGRVFGVELKARLSLPRLGRLVDDCTLRLSNDLRLGLTQTQKSMRDLPYPLLLLAFAMDSDRAFHAWLRKPVLPVTGRRQLSSPKIDNATEWRESTHVEIVALVNDWYDAGLRHAV